MREIIAGTRSYEDRRILLIARRFIADAAVAWYRPGIPAGVQAGVFPEKMHNRSRKNNGVETLSGARDSRLYARRIDWRRSMHMRLTRAVERDCSFSLLFLSLHFCSLYRTGFFL